MATITRNQNRRTLLLPTSCPVKSVLTITTLVRSGVTATATITSHGYSVGDWIVVSGSDLPNYNGPFQVVSVVDANNITYTMEADPGASSAGTPTAQKGIGLTNLWGDGTTPTGSPASVGALTTGLGGEAVIRIANPATAPTTVASATVYTSDTGLPGTWRELRTVTGSSVNATQQTSRVQVVRGKFVLVIFWGNAGSAVVCGCVGEEETSLASG